MRIICEDISWDTKSINDVRIEKIHDLRHIDLIESDKLHPFGKVVNCKKMNRCPLEFFHLIISITSVTNATKRDKKQPWIANLKKVNTWDHVNLTPITFFHKVKAIPLHGKPIICSSEYLFRKDMSIYLCSTYPNMYFMHDLLGFFTIHTYHKFRSGVRLYKHPHSKGNH